MPRDFGYDFFIDDNPEVKKRVVKAKKEAFAKGKAKGEVEGVKYTLLMLVELRFPALEAQMKQKVATITKIDQLDALRLHILSALTEEELRQILDADPRTLL